jgi:hypothetical protein
MSDIKQTAEVSGIEYVGPHSVRPGLYEITVTLADVPRTRLSLLFRPRDVIQLAHALQWNGPQVDAEDHVLADIAPLQT